MFGNNYLLHVQIMKSMSTFMGFCFFIVLGFFAHGSFLKLSDNTSFAWGLFFSGIFVFACAVWLGCAANLLKNMGRDMGFDTRYIFEGITGAAAFAGLFAVVAILFSISISVASGLIGVFVDDYSWGVRVLALAGAALFFAILCSKIADLVDSICSAIKKDIAKEKKHQRIWGLRHYKK